MINASTWTRLSVGGFLYSVQQLTDRSVFVDIVGGHSHYAFLTYTKHMSERNQKNHNREKFEFALVEARSFTVHDMVMTTELIKAHVNLWAHPPSINIYRITQRPWRLINRPPRYLQLVSSSPHHFGPQFPLKPCLIRLIHSNQFVQDHLQNELGNIQPHSTPTAVFLLYEELSIVLKDSPVLHVTNRGTFVSALTGSF